VTVSTGIFWVLAIVSVTRENDIFLCVVWAHRISLKVSNLYPWSCQLRNEILHRFQRGADVGRLRQRPTVMQAQGWTRLDARANHQGAPRGSRFHRQSCPMVVHITLVSFNFVCTPRSPNHLTP